MRNNQFNSNIPGLSGDDISSQPFESYSHLIFLPPQGYKEINHYSFYSENWGTILPGISDQYRLIDSGYLAYVQYWEMGGPKLWKANGEWKDMGSVHFMAYGSHIVVWLFFPHDKGPHDEGKLLIENIVTPETTTPPAPLQIKPIDGTTVSCDPQPLTHRTCCRAFYRTKDGCADYGFEFCTLPDGSFRAYITSQPSYQGRNESSHSTHRTFDHAKGMQLIDWADPVPSLESIKAIASMWADCNQEYIRTGKHFGPS